MKIKGLSGIVGSAKNEFRRKALLFSFFLFLAVVFWLMNALSKSYSSEIQYPIRYRNFPGDKVLLGEMPGNLTIRVYAHGYTLLRHKLSARYIPINFNVQSFSLNRLESGDSSFYYIETRFARDYISKQLNSEFEILEIKPDTLIFPFTDIISKKVEVRLTSSYKPARQFILKGEPEIIPDSVVVSGPEYLVDTLQGVYTLSQDERWLDADTEVSLPLADIKHITPDAEEVRVKFQVEKFTEKTLKIPIQVVNMPDTIDLRLFPSQVEVSCQVGLSNFEKLQPGMFKTSVDYSGVLQGQSRLNVALESFPDFVKSPKFNPRTVEYLIVKE
jgi:hypothetical protein